MKKLLICLLFVNVVTFFSFSQPAESYAAEGEEYILPDSLSSVTEFAELNENVQKEKLESTEPEQQEISDNKNMPAASDENKSSSEYQTLKDIKEPEITTLEPETEEDEEELVKIDIPPFVENKEAAKNTEKSDVSGEESHKEDKQVKKAEQITAKPAEKAKTENNINKTADEEPLEEVTEETVEPAENTITPSRSVTIKRKEYIDITYPGAGWIYSGLTDGSKDLSYFGRDLGTKDTTFTLQAKIPGTKILHFCKNDYLTGEYVDDYIEVIILQEEGSNKTHIKAPEYKQPEPDYPGERGSKDKKSDSEAEKQTENVSDTADKNQAFTENQKKEKSEVQIKKQANVKESSENNVSTEDDEISILDEDVVETSKNSDITDSDTLLKEANFLYNEKEFKAALEKVNKYLDFATINIDDGLLLKGKILEAQSDIQDIKGAIEIYNTLMKEYPASGHWDEANKRVIYLRRFYLEVR